MELKSINKKLLNIFKKNIVFILSFSLLFEYYIVNFSAISEKIPYFSRYKYQYYLVSYEYEFISRGLIGHIFNLIFEKIQYIHIFIVVNIFNITALLIVSYILSKLIKKLQNIVFGVCIFLLLIFNPASFILMVTGNEFARFDVLLLIVSISSLVILNKEKYVFFIPILSLIAMLIHEVFFFAFAPLILALIAYKFHKTKNTKWIKLFITNLLCVGIILFSIMQWGQITTFDSIEDYASSIQKNTEIEINTSEFSGIDATYFKTFAEHHKQWISKLNPVVFHNLWIATILLASFVYLQYILLYKYLIKCSKFIWILIASCFGILPLYFIAWDFGRWHMMIVTSLSMLFVYLGFENIWVFKTFHNEIMQKLSFSIKLIVFYILFTPKTPFVNGTFYTIYNIILIMKKSLL